MGPYQYPTTIGAAPYVVLNVSPGPCSASHPHCSDRNLQHNNSVTSYCSNLRTKHSKIMYSIYI